MHIGTEVPCDILLLNVVFLFVTVDAAIGRAIDLMDELVEENIQDIKNAAITTLIYISKFSLEVIGLSISRLVSEEAFIVCIFTTIWAFRLGDTLGSFCIQVLRERVKSKRAQE